jgi:hypothetical protein
MYRSLKYCASAQRTLSQTLPLCRENHMAIDALNAEGQSTRRRKIMYETGRFLLGEFRIGIGTIEQEINALFEEGISAGKSMDDQQFIVDVLRPHVSALRYALTADNPGVPPTPEILRRLLQHLQGKGLVVESAMPVNIPDDDPLDNFRVSPASRILIPSESPNTGWRRFLPTRQTLSRQVKLILVGVAAQRLGRPIAVALGVVLVVALLAWIIYRAPTREGTANQQASVLQVPGLKSAPAASTAKPVVVTPPVITPPQLKPDSKPAASAPVPANTEEMRKLNENLGTMAASVSANTAAVTHLAQQVVTVVQKLESNAKVEQEAAKPDAGKKPAAGSASKSAGSSARRKSEYKGGPVMIFDRPTGKVYAAKPPRP